MEQKIMVSVFCLVYNHEKYLRNCLEGFVNQKTNFKYEVLIHDDASTDKSAEIIKEYEELYPDIIKPIYQNVNQFSQGISIIATYQYPCAKGKYIAFCEGDDYWCDNQKLQKQFDLMEKNSCCSISVHKVRCICENGEVLNSFYPSGNLKTGIIESNNFVKYILCDEAYPFQTSSYFFRKDLSQYNLDDIPDFMKGLSFGDIPLLLYLATKGNLIYSEDVMSHYRVQSIGSWNSRLDKASTKNLDENKKMLKAFDDYTNGKFSKEIDYSIKKKEYWYYSVNKNYKMMLKRKYRVYFNKMNFKEKLFVYLKLVCGGKNSE